MHLVSTLDTFLSPIRPGRDVPPALEPGLEHIRELSPTEVERILIHQCRKLEWDYPQLQATIERVSNEITAANREPFLTSVAYGERNYCANAHQAAVEQAGLLIELVVDFVSGYIHPERQDAPQPIPRRCGTDLTS